MAKHKTVSIRLNVWANPRSRKIHLASSGANVISTISSDPESRRYHPHLFSKLRRLLKSEGRWPEGW